MQFSEFRGFSEVRLTVTCHIAQRGSRRETCVLNGDSLEKTEQPALRRVASTWIDEQGGVAGYPRRAILHGDMH
jgi:hypothetical protein